MPNRPKPTTIHLTNVTKRRLEEFKLKMEKNLRHFVTLGDAIEILLERANSGTPMWWTHMNGDEEKWYTSVALSLEVKKKLDDYRSKKQVELNAMKMSCNSAISELLANLDHY